jgi:hypothetical protein
MMQTHDGMPAGTDAGALIRRARDEAAALLSVLDEETRAMRAGDGEAITLYSAEKRLLAERLEQSLTTIGRHAGAMSVVAEDLGALAHVQAELAEAASRNMAAAAAASDGTRAAIDIMLEAARAESNPLEVYGRNGGFGRGRGASVNVDFSS